jgi:BolA protein
VLLFDRCLSGNTAEAIQKVDPQFIKQAQIEQSLTPGRNNGFLNMLRVMKQKAVELDDAAQGGDEIKTRKSEDLAEGDDEPAALESNEHGPKYNAIVAALQALKPTSLTLIDNSHQHAGHAGNDMDGESHFELQIVAEAFDGLNLVKRHKLIYMILGQIMPQIHALQIQSLTPEEVERK